MRREQNIKDLREIEVSDKNVPLRIAAFVMAFLLAVGAFGFGFGRLSHKDPGYYSISADPNDEAPLYGTGLSFRCYCAGGSDEIKAVLRALQPVYNSAMLESYKCLDARTVYGEENNLAALNAHIGEPVSVDPALCGVLLDAYEKTKEGRGYNLFAGPLYAEWTNLLYLEDPEDFDPLNDPDEAARLARLAELADDLSLYSLTVVDEASHTLRLDVDESVLRALAELELDAPIADLNLLHDAYRVKMVAQRLEEAGFRSGYLSSSDGVSLSLPELELGEFRLYGLTEEGAAPAASALAKGGTAGSLFHAFAYSDGLPGFYTLTDGEGKLHYRHPYVPADGRFPEKLLSSLTLDPGGDPVAACYLNICLNSLPSLRESREFAAQSDSPAAFTAEGGGRTVYINAAARNCVAPETDYGYETEEIA